MLRIFAVLTAASASRALADGSSGTLGGGTVDTYELRRGAVALDRMADLEGGRVLGRPEGAEVGSPQQLDAPALRALVEVASPAPLHGSVFSAEGAAPSLLAQTLETLGYAAPGDGGRALWRRVASAPSHKAKFQSADGSWWELAEEEIWPEALGAMADGITNDRGPLQDAVAAQRQTKRIVRLHKMHGLSQVLDLEREAMIYGTNPRHSGFMLNSAAARVRIGQRGPAAATRLERLVFDGGHLAETAIEFSADNYSGNARLDDVTIVRVTKVGLRLGRDSDDTQLQRLTIRQLDAEGTAADAVHVLSPCHFTFAHITRCNGYGIVTGPTTGANTQALSLYTFDNGRVNFCAKGLVYHDGTNDSGVPEGIATFTNTFFENCGLAVPGIIEPEDPVALTPASFTCAGGRLNLLSPKKLQTGWARCMFKAIRNGTIRVDGGGNAVVGNNSTTRDCTLFVVGEAAGHQARVELLGGLCIRDAARFTEAGRIHPRIGGWPLTAATAEIPWRFNGQNTTGWTATGAALSTLSAEADRLSGDGSMRIAGTNAASSPRASTTLRLPEAKGRLVAFRVVMRGEGSGGMALGLSLAGAGLQLLTPAASRPAWRQTDGLGVWTYHVAMAWVEDPAAEITATIHLNGQETTASVVVDRAEMLVIDEF